MRHDRYRPYIPPRPPPDRRLPGTATASGSALPFYVPKSPLCLSALHRSCRLQAQRKKTAVPQQRLERAHCCCGTQAVLEIPNSFPGIAAADFLPSCLAPYTQPSRQLLPQAGLQCSGSCALFPGTTVSFPPGPARSSRKPHLLPNNKRRFHRLHPDPSPHRQTAFFRLVSA